MSQSVRVIVSAALLVGAHLAVQFRSSGEAVQMRRAFSGFPQMVGGWKAQEETILQPDILNELRMSDYLMRRYVDQAGHSTWLYIGYWQSQRKGTDIHSPKNCLPAGGWEPVEASRLSIVLPAPYAPITVNRYLVQKDQHMQVVLYWYQSHGQALASEVAAKIELLRSAVVNGRTDGALVRVSSPVSGGAQETTDRLVKYVQTLQPLLSEYLPE